MQPYRRRSGTQGQGLRRTEECSMCLPSTRVCCQQASHRGSHCCQSSDRGIRSFPCSRNSSSCTTPATNNPTCGHQRHGNRNCNSWCKRYHRRCESHTRHLARRSWSSFPSIEKNDGMMMIMNHEQWQDPPLLRLRISFESISL